MKIKLLASTALLLSAPISLAQHTPDLIDQYCTQCHNFEDWAGKLDLGSLNFDDVASDAHTWEKVVRKIRAGMMPPKGKDRPSREAFDHFAVELESRLDANAVLFPEAPVLHRLNRNEYHNVIRDLLGLDIDMSAMLPQDDSSEGFDNIAAGLGFSPALIQGYVASAMKISRWAVGDMTATESTTNYKPPASLAQDQHLEGMPLGTRGGIAIEHNFPLDAEYEFVVRGGFVFNFNRSGNRDPSHDTDVEVTLDGEILKLADTRRFRLPITAGTHQITASIVDLIKPTGVNDVYSEYSVTGGINGVEIIGPYNATGPGNTASRQRIFSCYPQSNDEEQRCAEKIITDLARHAFRSPVTLQDLQPQMAFYASGAQQGGFENGIQKAISRILIDPRFLFRFEDEPAQVTAGSVYQISDIELASRLSFFLWSSIPDQELLTLAENNTLHEPAVLNQQVLRMLADQKAYSLVENFAGQWLHLRELNSVTPEAPAFDDNLRDAFVKETQLLIEYMIAQDLPVVELLDAPYTFVNDRLARHYDMENIRGSWFRKVDLAADSPRRGLLGQGSILTITSTASRTSPVIRGNWILGNLLSAPVPDPPPGVETNIDGDGSTEITASVRERLEAHRQDPSCSSCHSIIDPVGFSLENFDSVGAWRDMDGLNPVDSAGILTDGTPVASPGDLRNMLLSRSNLFVTTITEKLLTYALGRALDYHDEPTVRSVMKKAASSDYRFSALVNNIVQSPLFTQRIKTAENPQTAQAAVAGK